MADVEIVTTSPDHRLPEWRFTMAMHIVDAYPETCTVHTHQRSKSVWVASGLFQGSQLQQTGRTEKAALATWKEIAEFRYRTS